MAEDLLDARRNGRVEARLLVVLNRGCAREVRAVGGEERLGNGQALRVRASLEVEQVAVLVLHEVGARVHAGAVDDGAHELCQVVRSHRLRVRQLARNELRGGGSEQPTASSVQQRETA